MITIYSASESNYGGQPAITLTAASYQATVLPQHGGRVVSFCDIERGYRFLHEPVKFIQNKLVFLGDDYQAHPFSYGIPVLIPPNRFADGQFSFNGQVYHFPINEKDTNTHLHGFFYNSPWSVEQTKVENNEKTVCELTQKVNEEHPAYQFLPHRFTVVLRYELTPGGLVQTVSVKNEGNREMPWMFGFHTALQIPFAPDSQKEDCLIQVTIDKRWELSERKLPTGRLLPLDKWENSVATSGGYPFAHPVDNHYTAQAQGKWHGAKVIDQKIKAKLVYQVDPKFRHWMLWNSDANSGFFCPEPMTCMVNAPNMNLPASQTGLIALAPGSCWQAVNRLYLDSEI